MNKVATRSGLFDSKNFTDFIDSADANLRLCRSDVRKGYAFPRSREERAMPVCQSYLRAKPEEDSPAGKGAAFPHITAAKPRRVAKLQLLKLYKLIPPLPSPQSSETRAPSKTQKSRATASTNNFSAHQYLLRIRAKFPSLRPAPERQLPKMTT